MRGLFYPLMIDAETISFFQKNRENITIELISPHVAQVLPNEIIPRHDGAPVHVHLPFLV